DGVQIANEALNQVRDLIGSRHGKEYLPDRPRAYTAAAKNAQEAHEAIRPTDLFRRPERIRGRLRTDEAALYELIWKRTLASQMESAELDQVAIDIAAANGKSVLRTTGSVIKFAGFLTLYQEDRDDPTEDDDSGRRLPNLQANDAVHAGAVKPEQHFTQPPPRYSEASLIKRLEELGIGRPSTYTSILQTLEDRNYVRLEKKRLIPEDRGRLVTAFLTNFFERYVQYGFTADLEEKLDDISGGRAQWKDVLRDFWMDFSRLHQPANDQDDKMPSVDDAISFLDSGIGKRSVVIDALNDALAPHFFPPASDGRDTRVCPACKNGQLGIKLAKTPFIGCSNYPECRYTRPLAVANGEESEQVGPRELGIDSKSGKKVTLRKGPYGHYAQLDETGDEKPKRVSLPRGVTPDQVTLELALGLLSLPRVVGDHPETKKPIMAGIGRFGPYLLHDSKYKTIPKDDDVLSIGLNRALDLLAQESKGRGRNAPAPGNPIGNHPDDSQPVTLHDGRYGHYVKWGKINATIPKGLEPSSITLDQAVGLIAERAAKGGGGKARKPAAKKAAAKKAAPKQELSEPAPKAVTKAVKKATKKTVKKAAKAHAAD
ncbi:MAG: DNA topoisomerase, partial [Dongiaceae bacterium]